MPTTVKSLEERVDEMADDVIALKEQLDVITQELRSFRVKIDTTLGLMKWVGAFVAGVMITVIFSAITVAFSAGKLQSTVERLESGQKTQSEELKEIRQLLIRANGLQKAEKPKDDPAIQVAQHR